MSILEKKELRKEKLEELQSLINTKNEREDKTYTEDEVKRFEDLEAEVRKLDADIAQLEKEEEISKRKTTSVAKNTKTEETKIAERYSITEAVRQARTGRLEGLYAEMDQEARKDAAYAGISNTGDIMIPEIALRAENTVTAGTQPADGAALVDESKAGFIQFLYNQTILGRSGVQMLSGLSGNLEMDTEDSVAAANWATEIEAITPQKATFGNENMSPNRLAVSMSYSDQLLRQTNNPSIDAIVRRQMQEAISQKLDDTFINGATGLDGLASATGTLASADYDYDFLLEVLRKGEEANLPVQRIVSSPKARVKFMKEYTNAGVSGLPVLTGDQFITGAQLLSSNYVSNVAGVGTNETECFVFDPRQFYVGQWGGVSMIVDPYTGAKSAKTEITINTFWDMLLTRKAKAYKASIAIA